jgi:hypothetical protein
VIIGWILAAILGIVAGLTLSRAAFSASDIDTKQANVMIGVWAAIFVVFAASPWARLLIGSRSQFQWRLFGVYGWSSILVISCCATCLLIAIWKRIGIGRDS